MFSSLAQTRGHGQDSAKGLPAAEPAGWQARTVDGVSLTLSEGVVGGHFANVEAAGPSCGRSVSADNHASTSLTNAANRRLT